MQFGMGPLQDYARAHPDLKTCAGTTRFSGDYPVEMAARQLPCRFEDFEQLAGTYAALFASEESVMRFLRWKQLDLLVLPREKFAGESAPLRQTFERLQANPLVSTHESGPYLFLDLSRVTGVNRGR